jgi:hypothetical protein
MVFQHEAHIGVDADSDLVRTVRSTSGNVSDIAELTVCYGQRERRVWRPGRPIRC